MLALPLLFFGLVTAEAQSTHTVWDGNELRSAVSSASDGDTIVLGSGLFHLSSTLEITKDLEFVGHSDGSTLHRGNSGSSGSPLIRVQDNAQVVFTDLSMTGDGNRRVLEISGNNTEVELIRTMAYHGSRSSGAVIRLNSGALLTLTDSAVFWGNASTGENDFGGLIEVDGAHLVAENTEFTGGRAGSGGAIAFRNNATGEILNCQFRENQAERGRDHRGGGAIYHDGYTLTIEGSTFADNTAQGRGGAIHSRKALTVAGSHFDSGSSSRWGGHIHAHQGALTVTGSAFIDGVAQYGGAISATSDATLVLSDNGFWQNDASVSGGAVYTASSTFNATRNLFCGNAAFGNEDWSVGGGGVAVSSSSGNAELRNNLFGFNMSTRGGGGIHSSRHEIAVNHQHFVGNEARSGAAFYAYAGDQHHVYNSLFYQNHATDDDGQVVRGARYIYGGCASEVDLRRSSFFGNIASHSYNDCVSETNAGPTDDPLLTGTVDLGSCGPILNWVPAEGSPLIGGGWNGSTIGAFGGAEGGFTDDDEDGWVNFEDCDDTDPSIHPGTLWYPDLDGDGFGDANANSVGMGCGPFPDAAPNAWDCDDTDENIHPGAPEVCDGIDNNCNDEIDEGVGATWWPDADGDGFGDPNGAPIQDCRTAVPGYADNNSDCDDANQNINPNAVEICDGIDNNCNDEIDEGLPTQQWWPDADEDGFGDPNAPVTEDCRDLGPDYVLNDEDCDDTDPAIHPNADEICDGIDNNCNDEIDEGLPTQQWWPDADEDGFGDRNSQVVEDCRDLSPDHVLNNQDCDDSDPEVHPNAVEICDGIDNDCNNLIDDGLDVSWWPDTDGDGFGDKYATPVPVGCADSLPGYVANDGDCDDADPWVNPNAAEECDGIDNDCNGLIDDGLPTSVWYEDLDGDGYGNDAVTLEACYLPPGYASVGGDCDDTDPLIHPYTTWYADADGDGFGDVSTWIQQCEAPDGYVLDATDCDDADSDTYPGAPEFCDGKDNDCDDEIDNNVVTLDWYADEDGDGYGAGEAVSACAPPEGHVLNADDCDDTDPKVYPGAEEICDGKDNSCDERVDQLPDGSSVCEDEVDPEPGTPREPTLTPEEEVGMGCACSTHSGLSGGWLGLAVVGLFVGRRRRAVPLP